MRSSTGRRHPDPSEMRSYVTLYYNDSSGEVEKVSSQNLEPYRNDILQEASEKILKLFKNEILQGTSDNYTPAMPPQLRIHRHVDRHEDPMDLEDNARQFWSDRAQLQLAHEPMPRQHKPRKTKSKSISRGRDVVPHSIANHTSPAQRPDQDDMMREKLVEFRIDSKIDWEKWFYDAFRAVQQVGCRTMAKEWIKIIHPKKQSTNPYNGKNPHTRLIGDPDDIKPTYWPDDVQHKEPDHINKEERCKLLLHLLMQSPHKVLPQSNSPSQNTKEICAEALKSALDGKFDDPKYGLKHRRSIIEKIIYVRTQLEQYEDGGYPAHTTLSVPDYASSRRNNKDDDGSGDTTDDALEVITEHEDGNDDYVTVPVPTMFGHQPSDSELLERAQISRMNLDELQSRNRMRKKARRADAYNGTSATTQKIPLTWDPSSLPVDYGLQTPHLSGYVNGVHNAMNDNSIEMTDQMHPMSHPGPRGQTDDSFLTSWDPMSGPMNMPPQYNDPNPPNQRIASNLQLNTNQFMGKVYPMMPQQPFVGPFPYPQQFHYVPPPGQGFDQSAYFQ